MAHFTKLAFGVVLASGAAFAQPGYTFEMRIIGDGEADSPGGPTAAMTFPSVALMNGATRVGFWLQARVSQTVNQNWGIVRASSPAGAPSFITITDGVAGGTSFQRGTVNAAGTQFGRGYGYRNGGVDRGATSNTGGTAYPSHARNENGGLDGGADGVGRDRIYTFDCWVGAIREDPDLDGDGIFHSPFGVNGQDNPNPNSDPVPVPMGTFSPWANLYRFYVDWTDFSGRSVTINASALLNGAVQMASTEPGTSMFGMQPNVPGAPTVTASYSFYMPSPAVTVPLVAGAVFGGRRRR